MKQWDRVIIQCRGEASFEAGDALNQYLEENGYTNIYSGSGSPEDTALWWIGEYDRPVVGETTIQPPQEFTGGTVSTYFNVKREDNNGS